MKPHFLEPKAVFAVEKNLLVFSGTETMKKNKKKFVKNFFASAICR